MNEQKNKNDLRVNVVFSMSYTFLVLPFVIFSIGYFKPVIAIPVVMIVLLALYIIIVDIPKINLPKLQKKDIIRILVTLVIICLWVLLSGIGKVSWQSGDHYYRNAIYEHLVTETWPVGVGEMIGSVDGFRMLVYYIGFWLPSVIVGKAFGIQAGYKFQILWAILGILLVYLLFCIYRKKILIWPMIVFIFFSGLDIILLSISRQELVPWFTTEFLDERFGMYLFTSFTVDLFDVFNQSIPAWVATMLLLLQRNRKSIIFIWASVMLSAAFPFVGLIPFVIYFMVFRYDDEPIFLKQFAWWKKYIRSMFTFQNVAGGGVIGIFTFLYFSCNSSGKQIQQLIVDTQQAVDSQTVLTTTSFLSNVIANPIFQYLCVLLLEVGIYVFFIYKQQKKNSLFYLACVTLCTVPLIQIGSSVDFCMRASIPALFILYLFVVEYLATNNKRFSQFFLIAILLVASLNASHLLARAIIRREEPRQEVVGIRELCGGGNFGGSGDSFFFKKVCKPMKLKELKELVIDYCIPQIVDYRVFGSSFSVEQNQLVAQELIIEFDGSVKDDFIFEDLGMLDDNSVEYSIIFNGYDMGNLNYNMRKLILPKEYFNQYAQRIIIRINREVKLYGTDSFRLYKVEE